MKKIIHERNDRSVLTLEVGDNVMFRAPYGMGLCTGELSGIVTLLVDEDTVEIACGVGVTRGFRHYKIHPEYIRGHC